MQQVTLFTTAVDPNCMAVREFLTQNGVEFTEYDVNLDFRKRTEMMDVSKADVVPTIVIGDFPNADPENGVEVVLGFDEEKLRQLLDVFKDPA